MKIKFVNDTFVDESNRPVSRIAAIALVALLCSTALLNAQGGEDRVFRPTLLELRNPAGNQISEQQLEAATGALRHLAARAGIVLCYEDGGGGPPEVCPNQTDMQERNKVHTLRWNVQVRGFPAEDPSIRTFTLGMDIVKNPTKRRGRRLEWPESFNLTLFTQIELDEGISPERQELLLAKTLYDLIVGNHGVYDWLASLSEYDALLIAQPVENWPTSPVSRFAELELPPVQEPGPSPEEQLRAWEEEREAIVDALIEDRPQEALGRAEDLLAQDLPENLALRVRELLEKARLQVAAMTPPPPASPAGTEAPAEKALDVTFHVRYAPPGTGFRTGVDGRLRISDRDIRFVPSDPANGDGWSVKWPTLKSARNADGVWDVAHPLVIETNAGEKYFLTRINQQGRYDKGDRILEYIDKGKKRG